MSHRRVGFVLSIENFNALSHLLMAPLRERVILGTISQAPIEILIGGHSKHPANQYGNSLRWKCAHERVYDL